MKKLIVFLTFLSVHFIGFAQAEDAEGCKDHLLFNRPQILNYTSAVRISLRLK